MFSQKTIELARIALYSYDFFRDNRSGIPPGYRQVAKWENPATGFQAYAFVRDAADEVEELVVSFTDTLTRALALCLLALALAGCGKQGPGGEIWKEEVRLMNGDLIIIDQRNVYGSSGDLSASHGPLTEAEIRFDYKGKRYEWKQRAVWPMAIQEDPQGRIYIVSTIPYCWAWRELGRPKSYYVVHRYENGQWHKVDVSEVDPETVFNLAGSSAKIGTTKPRDFVSEKDWKYKNSDFEPNRHIVDYGVLGYCQ